MDKLFCTECGSEDVEHAELVYAENATPKALCWSCMRKLDLSWDHDERQFVDQTATCPDCDGLMYWCSCCCVYTQTCCVDYGTCQCS
jgi:hypothetical protein